MGSLIIVHYVTTLGVRWQIVSRMLNRMWWKDLRQGYRLETPSTQLGYRIRASKRTLNSSERRITYLYHDNIHISPQFLRSQRTNHHHRHQRYRGWRNSILYGIHNRRLATLGVGLGNKDKQIMTSRTTSFQSPP